MSTRIIALKRGQLTVDPDQDEIVLAGRGDRPSVTYLLHERRGTRSFYVYRPRQRAFGEDLHELCEVVPPDELQEAITRVQEYDDLAAYADLERLVELGFTLPD